MPKWLKKIGIISALVFMAFLVVSPIVVAQDGLFDTLETIKEKVGEGEGGIKIVDFSTAQVWGNLPPETQQVLEANGYKKEDGGLSLVITRYNNAVSDAVDNGETPPTIEEFVKGIGGMTDAEDNLNLHGRYVMSEIRYQGESQLQSVVLAVAKIFRNLMGALAAIYILVAGIMMVFAQGDDTKITQQKHAITYALIGLVVILLIERAIAAIYGVPGEERLLICEPGKECPLIKASADAVNLEIYGVISYLKAIVGSVAVFMVILSGIKTITAQGEEEKMAKQRKAILWTIVGLAVILINRVIVENLYINPIRKSQGQITQTNVEGILGTFGSVVQFLLGLVGVIAFAALVYGFGSMVANFGNEEMVARAKKIVMNAAIGIVVILSAFAIVSTVII